MQAARSRTDEGIESPLVDLGEVPLAKLRTLDGNELRNALRHAVEHASYIRVTASSGSQGAERVG